MTNSNERACAHCIHSEHSVGEMYECRLSPPETILDEEGEFEGVAFPLTRADLWCGQFSRRVN